MTSDKYLTLSFVTPLMWSKPLLCNFLHEEDEEVNDDQNLDNKDFEWQETVFCKESPNL